MITYKTIVNICNSVLKEHENLYKITTKWYVYRFISILRNSVFKSNHIFQARYNYL